MKSADPFDGVLLVDKSPAMTSHDVVAIVRKCLNTQKVGHCGTLDPFATGLLLIVIGRGTKIQDLLMSEDKEYFGTMKLGEITDTQDCNGALIEHRGIVDLDRSAVEAAFLKFHGDFYQTPPMVSAIKKDGVPLYKLARQGKSLSGSHAVSTSTPMRCATSGRQKSTSASSAAKDSTCAPMPTTLASNLAAEPTCRPCDEPGLDDFPLKMRSRLTN